MYFSSALNNIKLWEKYEFKEPSEGTRYVSRRTESDIKLHNQIQCVD